MMNEVGIENMKMPMVGEVVHEKERRETKELLFCLQNERMEKWCLGFTFST
jgi:hypothetical protein